MRFLLSCISFAVSLHAASFVQVQCGSPLGTPIRYNETDDSSSCSCLSYKPSDIPRGSFASGSVTLQMATDSSQYSTLNTSQSAGATIATPPGSALSIGTGSSITIGYETQIHTLGAERPGYMQIGSSYGIANAYFAGGAMSSMISGFNINTNPFDYFQTTVQFCGSEDVVTPCTPSGSFFQNQRGLIPITLGTNLTLIASGSTRNSADNLDGSSSGALNTQFQFRFLEADGVTPAAASEVPEPATWSVFLSGLLLVCAGRMRKSA